MAKNEFLLPNELGWECNDELRELLSNYAFDWANLLLQNMEEPSKARALAQVRTAQAMDDAYAVIKKYQGEQDEVRTSNN